MKQRRISYIIDVDFVEKVAEVKFEHIGDAVSTVDAEAEDSVCPWECGEASGMIPIQLGCEMNMVNAAGDQMPHYGSRRVVFEATGFQRQGQTRWMLSGLIRQRIPKRKRQASKAP